LAERLSSSNTNPADQKGLQMVNTRLVKTEDELREFYDWLLWRAQEEEGVGRESNGRVYREYAETVKNEIGCQ
jgi:hypothetical protein